MGWGAGILAFLGGFGVLGAVFWSSGWSWVQYVGSSLFPCWGPRGATLGGGGRRERKLFRNH